MAKKGILVLMMVALMVLVGCEEGDPQITEIIDQSWVQDGSYWEDGAGNSFSYKPSFAQCWSPTANRALV